MRTLTIALRLGLLGLLIGCGNTADGVKEDAERAADKSANAMGGALETASVKAAIIADDRVGAGDINVDTDEATRTVTLKGTVRTAEQKRIAGEIAASKATGYTIVNNLAVRP